MMIGMKMDGRSFLSKMLDKGSNTEYDTKKMVKVLLNWPTLNDRSVCSPAILALPMLVLSRNASR